MKILNIISKKQFTISLHTPMKLTDHDDIQIFLPLVFFALHLPYGFFRKH